MALAGMKIHPGTSGKSGCVCGELTCRGRVLGWRSRAGCSDSLGRAGMGQTARVGWHRS